MVKGRLRRDGRSHLLSTYYEGYILVHLPHLSAPVRGGTAKAPILQTGQIKNLLKVMQLLSAFDLRLV